MDAAETAQAETTARPRRGWFRRNWKWFVPVALLGIILLGGGGVAVYFLLHFRAITNSEPYQMALAQVQKDAAMVAEIGEPIRDVTRFPGGGIHVEGDGGEANLLFQVEGPEGEADIRTEARRYEGYWNVVIVEATLEDGQRLVLETQGAGSGLAMAPLFHEGLETVEVKSSEPYRLALEQLKRASEVTWRLGKPVVPDETLPPGGVVPKAEDGATASIYFEVRGPKGSGHVEAQAKFLAGQWGLTRLEASFQSGQRLLLNIASPNQAPLFKSREGGEYLRDVKSSRPYELALERVQQSPKVIAWLDEPIRPSNEAPAGYVYVDEDHGDAEIDFHVRGPKEKAKVRTQAALRDGEWSLVGLQVVLPSEKQFWLDPAGD